MPKPGKVLYSLKIIARQLYLAEHLAYLLILCFNKLSQVDEAATYADATATYASAAAYYTCTVKTNQPS